MSGTHFKLKEIEYFNRKVKILCQNLNGPCPLLSLCNVLILNGKINIHSDYTQVSLDMITQLIANELLEKEQDSCDNVSTDMKVLRQERLGVAISMLPSLQRGLDVNVKFNDVSSFEYTRELDCFDAFSVPLYHGWIYDSQDRKTSAVIQDMTYNHLQFKLVEANNLPEIVEDEEQEDEKETNNDHEQEAILELNKRSNCFVAEEESKIDTLDQTTGETYTTVTKASKETRQQSQKNAILRQEAKIIEEFLAETASQLTYAGLLALHDSIPEGSLCTFFRNNHFSTMLKRENSLYLLVTDLGYADKSNVVWELLDEIDGNTELVDGRFIPIFSSAASGGGSGAPSLPGSNNSSSATVSAAAPIIDPDYLLALQLSEEQPGGSRPQQGHPPRQGKNSSQHVEAAVGYALPPTSAPARTAVAQQQHQQTPPSSSRPQQPFFQQQEEEQGIPVAISSMSPAPTDAFKSSSSISSSSKESHSDGMSGISSNSPWYPPGLSQEESDRQTALELQASLQQEDDAARVPASSSLSQGYTNENAYNEVHHLQQALSPAELDSYRQAELNYFRNRDTNPAGLSQQQQHQQQQQYETIQRRARKNKQEDEKPSSCTVA